MSFTPGIIRFSGYPATSSPPPAMPVRFGESVNAKLNRYEHWLHRVHLPRLSDKDAVEPTEIFTKVRRDLRNASEDVTLKKPGDYVFVVWDKNGFATRPAGRSLGSEGTPEGFFWSDMQYLDHFVIRGPGGQPLKLTKKNLSNDEAGFHYEVEGQPKLAVHRFDSLDRQNLYQSLNFRNDSFHDAQFTVEIGTSANDIFQARTGKTDGILNKQKAVMGTQNNFDLSTFVSRPGHDEFPENLIKTLVHLEKQNPGSIKLQPKGTDILELIISVPAGKSVDVPLVLHSNNLMTELKAPTTAFNDRKWDKTMPQLAIKSAGRAYSHLPQVWDTATADLKRLTIPVQCGDKTYFPLAAGIPNFLALFGRDSLITSMQVLPFNPSPARETLYVLSHFQGDRHDPFREMEPGKILHELRYGELTRLGVSPHSPYYGTMDATPLFVMMFDKYLQRTHDTQAMNDLWGNMERALGWIDNQIVRSGPLEGFLAQRHNEQTEAGILGLKNIGWKDSGHAMRHLVGKDGKLTDPEYPIAPAEVQAYVYGAWKGAARLYRKRAGSAGTGGQKAEWLQKAQEYEDKAARLKTRFNEKYWMPEKNFIATALQANGQPLPSVSSNGVQALLTGIVDEDKASKMIAETLKPHMLSGWGLRTLSSDEPAFDALSYQNGGIWPHDNALMVAGMKGYGNGEAVRTVSDEVLQAARMFKQARLPEVYAGFERKKGDRKIIPYPDTCTPQAWAAGTPFLLLASMLGLEIDAESNTIRFNQPMLSTGMRQLQLKNLTVSPGHTVDLDIRSDGRRVKIAKTGGSADVSITQS